MTTRSPHGPPARRALMVSLVSVAVLGLLSTAGAYLLPSLVLLFAGGEAFTAIDDTRPTVIFAYTVKGHGLATEGHPQNHSSLLTVAQFGELVTATGADALDAEMLAGVLLDTVERAKAGPSTKEA